MFKKITLLLFIMFAFLQSEAQNEFITTWQTTTANESITIPVDIVYTYNYSIDWGDGIIETAQAGSATHSYSTAGTYTVKINGAFPAIRFNDGGDTDKILTIEQWGNIAWRSFEASFYGCSNLVSNATDTPDLTNVTDLSSAFRDCENFNGNLNSWNLENVENISFMFYGATNFNSDIAGWNVSKVTAMEACFYQAENFNQNISGWNTASLTNMRWLFYGAEAFNQDLSGWDVSEVTNMNSVFRLASNFNGDVSTWNVSRVKDMSYMFLNDTVFTGDLSNWQVDSVENMQFMFTNAYLFNSDISGWNTASLTSLSGTFQNLRVFNQNIGAWDVSKVQNLSSAFRGTGSFDQDISGWNVSSVTLMRNTFSGAAAFNRDIGSWDVSNVEDIEGIFQDATAFNQDISSWNISKVTDFEDAFNGASAFNQNLGDWDMLGAVRINNMLSNSGLDVENYDSTLIAWAEQTLPNGLNLGATSLQYCDADLRREYIINEYNWSFTGDVMSCADSSFITTWQTTTTNESITIPTVGTGYSYDIDWGDGTIDIGLTGDATHTYTLVGTYTVRILGDFPRIYFNNAGDKSKIRSIEQWGNIQWKNFGSSFYGCDSLLYNATDAPDLTLVTSMNTAFRGVKHFTGDLSNWGVSTITDMRNTFLNNEDFNGDISSWNVSNVTQMNNMFRGATAFNQDLGSWDVSMVIDMSRMLENSGLSTPNYDSTLIGWSTQTLQNGVALGAANVNYCNATTERQDIINNFGWTISDGGLDCSNSGFITTWETTTANDSITIPTFYAVTYNYSVDWGDGTVETGFTDDATHTYASAGIYTVKIYGTFPAIYFEDGIFVKDKILTVEQWGNIEWQTMERAFRGCKNLTVNATDAPDLTNVTSLSYIFAECESMNTDISHWDVSGVLDMSSAFAEAIIFNQPLASWNVSNVTNMQSMFEEAIRFNQDISGWNTSKVAFMGSMFREAYDFNQDISGWNTSQVGSMSYMFSNANSFDQNLGNWDISNVTSIINMFNNSDLSVPNYDSTLIGWSKLTLQNGLFFGASGVSYCDAATERQSIIDDYSWFIIDGGQGCPFVTTWQTTTANESIRIPASSSAGFDYDIYWGDGASSRGNTGSVTHTYVLPGIYTVKIYGDFPEPNFRNNSIRNKLLSIEQWGDIVWQSMNYAFMNCENLIVNATDAPDLSNVTSLQGMFQEASSFNQDISHWNVSNIENMSSMFAYTTNFNQPLNSWNVSNVTDMSNMFRDATSFNQPLDAWNVSKVTDMQIMFSHASSFNQDISSWNVSNVNAMRYMFREASSFNQNIGGWDVSGVGNFLDFLSNSGLSVSNYDSLLTSWSKLALQTGMTFEASGLNYCNSDTERQSIITNFGWTITDAGQSCPFTTTWETTVVNDTITIPTNSSYTYNYKVNWGDGTIDSLVTGDIDHVYDSIGTYTIEILGDFPAIYFNNGGDDESLLSIEQWGEIEWESMERAFFGCRNMELNATDAPDLSNVTSLANTFRNCRSMTNPDLTNWDVSNVINMNDAFKLAIKFNGNVSNWDVSNVINMRGTFSSCSAFTGDLSNWNVSGVTNMTAIFFNADIFNSDISRWDVSNVTSFDQAFQNCNLFNQDISQWDVGNVTNFNFMFLNAYDFDQNLGAWNMSKANTMIRMLDNSDLSNSNYDATLIGWAAQAVKAGLTLDASGLEYCISDVERQKLINDFGWTINDAGLDATCLNTTTWDGISWSAGTPIGGTLAILDADYDTYTDGTLYADFFAVKPNRTLLVRGDSAATIVGSVINLGTIHVQDTSSFIQTTIIADNSGSGNYIVEREGADYQGQYNYWSSPVMNTTINDVFSSKGKSFYTFDNVNQAWQGANTATVLQAGQGFIATGTSSTPTTIVRTFSDNTGFNTGDIYQSLYYSGSFHADSNWHLVGNPYPSGLDVNRFITENTGMIEDAVYLWSSDGSDYSSSSSDYATMNSLGTVNAGGSGVAPGSATVASCQGFFVQSMTNGNLLFSNNQRVSTNNTFLKANSERARVWFGVENENGIKNEILIGFDSEAEEGKDKFDANKLSGNDFVSLYSIGDFKSREHKLAIQGLPLLSNETIIPIGIEAKEGGEFVFSINHLDGIDELTEVYLQDAITGDLVDLRTGDYKVSLENGESNDRFELRFVVGKVTNLPEEVTDLGIRLFSSQKSVNLQFTNPEFTNSLIAVYDISGRQIGIYHNENAQEVRIPLAQTGIYIVRVANQAGVMSQKVFVE